MKTARHISATFLCCRSVSYCWQDRPLQCPIRYELNSSLDSQPRVALVTLKRAHCLYTLGTVFAFLWERR